jgi:hypothetical protein
MTEIKKALQIIKARWPEAALIIGIGLLSTPVMLLATPSQIGRLYSTALFRWLTPVFQMVVILVLLILRSGFLRTVYLESQKRQSFLVLLRTGFHFLWRMIVLGVFYRIFWGMLTWLSTYATYSVGKLVASREAGISHAFFSSLLVSAVTIILMKLILLLPALVIVLDCGAFESFKLLKKYRFREARELIALFCFRIALGCLWIFLQPYNATILRPIFRIGTVAIMDFISLTIVIMAVRFVASHNLVYDRA